MYVVDSDANAKRGPYLDAVARHDTIYSEYHKSSYLCATCHDVSNPVYLRNPDDTYTANEFGLQFLSLGTESFDFVIPRDIWFRHLFLNLIEKIDSEPGHRLAQELGGYYIENCGKLIWGDD